MSHTRTEQDGVHEVVRTYMQIKRKGGSTLRANQNLARLKTTRDITLGTRQNFRQLTHAPFTRCHYAQLQLGESNSLWMPENLRREVGGRPTALGRGCVKTHRAEGHVGSWPLRSTQDRRSELREGFEHPRKQVHHEFSHSLGRYRPDIPQRIWELILAKDFSIGWLLFRCLAAKRYIRRRTVPDAKAQPGP